MSRCHAWCEARIMCVRVCSLYCRAFHYSRVFRVRSCVRAGLRGRISLFPYRLWGRCNFGLFIVLIISTLWNIVSSVWSFFPSTCSGCDFRRSCLLAPLRQCCVCLVCIPSLPAFHASSQGLGYFLFSRGLGLRFLHSSLA